LTESERANRLLNLHGLDDRKLSELMDEMVALLEEQRPCFIFRQLFINQLPASLQVQMANVEFQDAHQFAHEADKYWNAKVIADSSNHSSISRVVPEKISAPRQRPSEVPLKEKSLCFFHAKYGSKAHRCRQPCSFKGNSQAGRQ